MGGVIGGIAAGNDIATGADRQNQMLNRSSSLYDMVNLPQLDQAINYDQFQSAGALDPALEQTILQNGTAYNDIKEDPSNVSAQKDALAMLMQRGRTGMSLQDKAALSQIKQQAAEDAQSKQAQILQQMQQRGMGGSGAELAAQLSSSQNSANQESQNSLAQAAQAQQNALSAISQGAGLAGNIRSQDYQVAQNRANAIDQMNRFNVQNQNSSQARNVGSQNQAQQYNLTNNQQISNANVAQSNAEKQRQLQAKQQQFQNQMGLNQAKSGIYGQQGNAYNTQGQQRATQDAATGKSVDTGIASIFGFGG